VVGLSRGEGEDGEDGAVGGAVLWGGQGCAPRGGGAFSFALPRQAAPIETCGDCPSDGGSTPTASTIALRWNFLSLSQALSKEGAFSRVVASVALSWRFGLAPTIGRIERFRRRFCPQNRVLGFSFSVSSDFCNQSDERESSRMYLGGSRLRWSE
jgi:hypothetical protein